MHLWRAFRALDPDARRLIVEATVLLGFVWIGLRTLSFSRLRRALEGSSKTVRPVSRTPPSLIGWAVGAAGRRFPGRTCLMEALAAEVMLRRRGYKSQLHFGVRKSNDRPQPLDAHAWVECEDRIVVGELDTLSHYLLQSAPERS